MTLVCKKFHEDSLEYLVEHNEMVRILVEVKQRSPELYESIINKTPNIAEKVTEEELKYPFVEVIMTNKNFLDEISLLPMTPLRLTKAYYEKLRAECDPCNAINLEAIYVRGYTSKPFSTIRSKLMLLGIKHAHLVNIDFIGNQLMELIVPIESVSEVEEILIKNNLMLTTFNMLDVNNFKDATKYGGMTYEDLVNEAKRISIERMDQLRVRARSLNDPRLERYAEFKIRVLDREAPQLILAYTDRKRKEDFIKKTKAKKKIKRTYDHRRDIIYETSSDSSPPMLVEHTPQL